MSRSEEEIKAILARFRAWLTQTIDQIERIDPAEAVEEDKTNDSGLDPFTAFVVGPAVWAEEVTRFDESIETSAPEEADQSETSDASEASAATTRDEPAAPLPDVGLRQLVEAFTAMRHDLKLQTKSARGLETALQPALAGLEKAMHQFQTAGSCEREAGKRAAKPFVETLIELDEAFLRGAKAFESIHERISRTSPERPHATPDDPPKRRSQWRQWLVRGQHRQPGQSGAEPRAGNNSQEIDHLMAGYALIQARIERALREHQITRIECVGRRADPSEMTVVELVDAPNAEPETVVEEVRPGYKWRDEVIRYAEVCAVRGS